MIGENWQKYLKNNWVQTDFRGSKKLFWISDQPLPLTFRFIGVIDFQETWMHIAHNRFLKIKYERKLRLFVEVLHAHSTLFLKTPTRAIVYTRLISHTLSLSLWHTSSTGNCLSYSSVHTKSKILRLEWLVNRAGVNHMSLIMILGGVIFQGNRTMIPDFFVQ